MQFFMKNTVVSVSSSFGEQGVSGAPTKAHKMAQNGKKKNVKIEKSRKKLEHLLHFSRTYYGKYPRDSCCHSSACV